PLERRRPALAARGPEGVLGVVARGAGDARSMDRRRVEAHPGHVDAAARLDRAVRGTPRALEPGVAQIDERLERRRHALVRGVEVDDAVASPHAGAPPGPEDDDPHQMPISWPPQTLIACAVMKSASLETRNATAFAWSSGLPGRPSAPVSGYSPERT